VAVRKHPRVETPGYCRVVPLGRAKADLSRSPQFVIRTCHGSFPVFSFRVHANDIMPLGNQIKKEAGGDEFWSKINATIAQ